MDLQSLFKKQKPNASDITLKTYISNLQNLHKVINNKKDIDSLEFLEDIDKVLDALKEKSMQTIKNYLVPVVISLSSEDKYKTLIEKYNMKIKELQDKILDIYDKNEKSEKQEANWLDHNEILKLLRKLKKDTKELFEKPMDKLNNKEKDLIQQYLIIYLYSGKSLPVLRNDYAEMKIVDEDEKMSDNKNYLVIKKKGNPYFKLNAFKTSKYKGEQEIPIKDIELKKLINKWLKIQGTDYLLINTKDFTPMTANGITKYLNKIFQKHYKKNVSSSLLRSIYITKQYENPKLTISEKKKLADEMLHSKNVSESVYNKID